MIMKPVSYRTCWQVLPRSVYCNLHVSTVSKKTDMNVERFPSGKLAVNTLFLHIAMIAFNSLRMIGQTALQFSINLPYRHKGKRKRLRKVIDDLIKVSCKLVPHARKFMGKLWCHDPWYAGFKSTYLAL
jgi:hypothetical protein